MIYKPDPDTQSGFSFDLKCKGSEFMAKQKILSQEEQERIRTKDFFDCIFPGVIKFMSDYYICGNSYKCTWVIKGYPPSTDAQALHSQLSDKAGVTLRYFFRLVEPLEQRKIIQDSTRKNTMQSSSNDVNETITASENLQDVVEMLSNLRKSSLTAVRTRAPRKTRRSNERVEMSMGAYSVE